MKNNALTSYEDFYSESISVLTRFGQTHATTTLSVGQLGLLTEFQNIMHRFPGIVGILNLGNRKYEFVSENVQTYWGYPSRFFIENNFEDTVKLFRPDQAKHILGTIFPTLFNYLQEFAQKGEALRLKFSYESIILRNDGTQGWYFHQFTVLHTDANQIPTHLLKSVSDINDIKKDENITFTIQVENGQGGYSTIYKETFYEQPLSLSEREIDVLKLLSNGLSSKQIADELNISTLTVSTHRRNMLKKINSKSTGELIHRAKSLGWM